MACYHRIVAKTPEQRLQRLRRHALSGWHRARNDVAIAERAQNWLALHPTAMPTVDQLWFDALQGRGSLAQWLLADAPIAQWSESVPLHSVLACHPFPDLPQWMEVPK